MKSLYIGIVNTFNNLRRANGVFVTLLVSDTKEKAYGTVYKDYCLDLKPELRFINMEVVEQNRLELLMLLRDMRFTEDEIRYISHSGETEA